MNLPTAVTLSRVLLVPLFVFLVEKHPVWGCLTFVLASLTDLLDGYLARRSRQVTKLGIILDPIADKVLVITALIVLVDLSLVPAGIAIVIIVREFLVTGLRLVALSRDLVMPAETGGKYKTGFQIAAIIIFLVSYSGILGPLDLYWVGIVCIWLALILGLTSGVQYFLGFIRQV